MVACLTVPGRGAWAFVRWLEDAPQTSRTAALGMTRLRWSYHQRLPPGAAPGARTQRLPWYDLVHLGDIIEPVCLQPDCTAEPGEGFFYNHNVR